MTPLPDKGKHSARQNTGVYWFPQEGGPGQHHVPRTPSLRATLKAPHDQRRVNEDRQTLGVL